MEITKEQFEEYTSVQESGMFNMFSPRAREMTSLSKNEWLHIISNYNQLKIQYKESKWNHYHVNKETIS